MADLGEVSDRRVRRIGNELEPVPGCSRRTDLAWHSKCLSQYEQDSVIEFLNTLQVLPPGTRALIVDEHGHKKHWPPNSERSEDAEREERPENAGKGLRQESR
jgi:hypothetical protein